CMQGLQLPYTC
nr:immunoglobulin light chain junction region [Macaca mulatta]MOW72931.1 immunoglobulin light chain junction region [Macaca mulatta]MOW72989.1 immunoglobulin light chain junction region [Macaca mulatta]MOW72999.1 immunoglobulin light chain junction region [Macaca mulatta]MOW73000.1 immunoglobulin light chain junction region [Macaca mulatta]